MSGVDSLIEKRKSQMSVILNWAKTNEETKEEVSSDLISPMVNKEETVALQESVIKFASPVMSNNNLSLTLNESIVSLFGNAANESPKQTTSSPIDTTILDIESIRQLSHSDKDRSQSNLSCSLDHTDIEDSCLNEDTETLDLDKVNNFFPECKI